MTQPLPICTRPQAFKMLAAQLPFLESPDGLIAGAVAVATHQNDAADYTASDAQLQNYADTVRSRVRGSQIQAVLAHLHELLFEEEGFAGNTSDYYNTANSYLPTVLETKRGLPITLSLVYKNVAQRLGLPVFGVGLPGHFLVGVRTGGTTLLVDPFYGGRSVSMDEAHARVQQALGSELEWTDDLLQPVSNRQWLTRILQNLLNTFASSSQYLDVAAMLEMEMLLWPGEDRLQRDLALVLARCGLSQPAWVWLDRYLKNNPDDPQTSDLRQLLEVLGT